MAKRNFKPRLKAPRVPSPERVLEKSLQKQSKADLVKVLMEIARDNRAISRQLESRFGVETQPKDLVVATRVAIADATEFDERDINHNFDYDYDAYEEVKRNFQRLIKLGNLREAMELSLELMRDGSYQVEMSDEGLMSEDIQDCLQVVINALKKSSMPPEDIVAWCAAMAGKDRVGFICNKELKSLQQHCGASK